MATQIIPGVYELFVPIPNNPLGNTNTYLLKGNDGHRDGHILIDAGWDSIEALHSLESELRQAGADFKDIGKIIVTHAHFDHYGLVGRVRQLSHAKVYLHRRDEEVFHTRYAVTEDFMRRSEEWFRLNGAPHREFPMGRFAFGGQRTHQVHRPDVELNGGETVSNGNFELTVVWTPGHSPGHVCLHDAAHRLFFSGDHILPVITPNVGLPPHSDGNPLGDFIASLKKVRELPVDKVLPAHENVFDSLPKRVDEILHHHEVRNREILAGIVDGPKTAYELSGHVTWMPELGGVKFRDLMPGDQRAAMSETLAHLRAMQVERRVKTSAKAGVIYYEALAN
jgi:glyoxylase-like metal-dependent hydrolase (beta-lactamase superfamily II)